MVSATTMAPGRRLKDEQIHRKPMALSGSSYSPPRSTPPRSISSQGPPWTALSREDGLAPSRRDYRLIDGLQQPHPHLDGLYESVEEALADAIGWLQSMGPGAGHTSIGLEVSTPCGSWRTIRQPDLLLCPLPPQR